VPPILPQAAYAAVVAAVLMVSAWLFARLKPMEQRAGDFWRICLVCLVYAIIVPHFKDYSYILLIPPAVHVLTSCRWLPPALPLLGLLMLCTLRNFQALGTALEPLCYLEAEYFCLLLAALLFVLAGCSIWLETRDQKSEL
jgi:hypothetical protein